MTAIVISSMSMAIICFCFSLLPFQNASPTQKLFAILLVCLLFLSSGPLVFETLPQMTQGYVALIPTVFFAFLSSLWLYHDSLISEHAWHWRKTMSKHLIVLLPMLLLTLSLALLPSDQFHQLFFTDKPVASVWIKLVARGFFIAALVWHLLSFSYLISIIKRTLNYRRRLNQVYAEQQGKTLKWLMGFCGLLCASWVYAVLLLALEDRFVLPSWIENGLLLLLLGIIWFVAVNGLRQRPGFEGEQLEQPTTAENDKKRYQNSALNNQDLSRIATKLAVVLDNDKLYLQPDISLSKLSKHIGVPSQYVSQTLSQHLDTTFFDFINLPRIEDAKQLLVDTDDSVLDIAMAIGFNARSSFYKAFKQFTDLTPSQYRANHG